MVSPQVGSRPVDVPVVTQRRNSWTYNIEPALKAGVPADKLNAHIDDIEREIEESGMRGNVFHLSENLNVEMRFLPTAGKEAIQDELVLRPKPVKDKNKAEGATEEEADDKAEPCDEAKPSVLFELIIKRREAKVVKLPKEDAATMTSLLAAKQFEEYQEKPAVANPGLLHRMGGILQSKKKKVSFPAEGIPSLVSKAQYEAACKLKNDFVRAGLAKPCLDETV